MKESQLISSGLGMPHFAILCKKFLGENKGQFFSQKARMSYNQ